MSQNAYLRLLRQYAALARRYNRSFAEAVNAIIAERSKTVTKEAANEQAALEELGYVEDQATREYGAYDRDFTLERLPF